MARGKLLDPIHPGEILREEFMKPLGVSINGLARDIAVPPGRISAIVNGKRAITADTALRLGKYFGVSSELWLGLQTDFDLGRPSARSDRRSTGGSAPGSPDRSVFALLDTGSMWSKTPNLRVTHPPDAHSKRFA